MKRSKKHNIFTNKSIFLVAIFIFFNVLGISYAYFKSEVEVTNILSTGEIRLVFIQDYNIEPDESVKDFKVDIRDEAFVFSGNVSPHYQGILTYNVQNTSGIPILYREEVILPNETKSFQLDIGTGNYEWEHTYFQWNSKYETFGPWEKELIISGFLHEETSPPPIFKKITGGGQLKNNNNSFGFNIHSVEEGVKVNLNYNDVKNNIHINSTNKFADNITGVYDDNGNLIGLEFFISEYTQTSENKDFSTIFIRVVDNGEPGVNDEFFLSIKEGEGKGYDSGDPIINSGNIQLHK